MSELKTEPRWVGLAQSRLEATMGRGLQQTLTRNIGFPGDTVTVPTATG